MPPFTIICYVITFTIYCVKSLVGVFVAKIYRRVTLLLLEARQISLSRSGQELFSACRNLALHDGENLLILGPSGCGKTSLLHVLAGLLPPDNGDVLFKGEAYSTLPAYRLDQIRSHNFGFVFQSLHLVRHLTVMQNIALAYGSARRSPDIAAIDSLCEALGLQGKKKQRAYTLSQGEAQRVGLARACVHSPCVIFADEPTSALDDANTNQVMTLLSDLAKRSGTSLVVSTHDQRIKPYFQHILEMAS